MNTMSPPFSHIGTWLTQRAFHQNMRSSMHRWIIFKLTRHSSHVVGTPFCVKICLKVHRKLLLLIVIGTDIKVCVLCTQAPGHPWEKGLESAHRSVAALVV